MPGYNNQKSYYNRVTKLILALFSCSIFIFENSAIADEAKTLPKKAVEKHCWTLSDKTEACDDAPAAPTYKFTKGDSPLADHEADSQEDKNYFPEAARRNSQEQELKELKKLQEAEKQSIKDHDDIEKRKVEAMEEIQKYKFQMAEQKLKQEKMAQDLEVMNNELLVVTTQQNSLKEEARAIELKGAVTTEKTKIVQDQLRESQKNLANEGTALSQKKRDTEMKIANMQIEMQKAIAKIAKDQSTMSRIESEKTQLESQEIQFANQLSAIKEKQKQIADEHEQLNTELNNLKSRVNSAKNEYKVASAEAATMEKETKTLTAQLEKDRVRSASEIHTYEQKILAAKDSKIKNELEMAKSIAESEQMKNRLLEVQKKYDMVASEEAASNTAAMESRVDYETTKTEVSKKESGIEELQNHGKNQRTQIRNLASMAETSEMLETQQKAKVVKSCKVLRSPKIESDSVGKLKKGSVVIAAPAQHGFYKVLNSSGSPQFVSEECLNIEN